VQRNYPYHGEFGTIDEMKWKIKDANETLEGTYIDEKDEERNIRMYDFFTYSLLYLTSSLSYHSKITQISLTYRN
jgi:hypothetical protein